MPFELPFGVKRTTAGPVDEYYGPHATVAAACAAIPLGVRYGGQVVYITGIGRHEWLAGNLLDGGLAPIAAVTGGVYRGPWTASTAYARYDTVIVPAGFANAGLLVYNANAAFTSPATYTAANWTIKPGQSSNDYTTAEKGQLATLTAYVPITSNQYGIHPALSTQAFTNGYLLGRVTANVAPTIGTPSLSSTSITVGASVTATASAADSDGTVASVEYFLDGASRGSSAVGPSYPVAFTPAVTGSRLITAQATDNLGAKSVISAGATLLVNGANTAPGQVTGVTATAASATSIYATYTAPANGGSAITDYLYEYSSNGGTTYTAFAHTATTGTAVTITGLTAATAYLVRVSAINAVGTGPVSATATATTPAPAAAQTLTANSSTPS